MCMNYSFCMNVTWNWVNNNLVDLDKTFPKKPCLDVHLFSQCVNNWKGWGEKIWQAKMILISHHHTMQKHQDREFLPWMVGEKIYWLKVHTVQWIQLEQHHVILACHPQTSFPVHVECACYIPTLQKVDFLSSIFPQWGKHHWLPFLTLWMNNFPIGIFSKMTPSQIHEQWPILVFFKVWNIHQ